MQVRQYDHRLIEEKWRNKWALDYKEGKSTWAFNEERGLKGDKLYLLDMFPYPSGSGLHVGHVEEKAALDIYARYMRMLGKNVLMPTGYDSFGLPTENYALKNNLKPQDATSVNVKTFRAQTEKIGISYDWDRELAASDVEYYKFTQWWFKFLYDRGLAYRKNQAVNWCPNCQTVIANEQVVDGRCERCDTPVIQKDMEQWFFKITDFAERLLTDLDKLDWPESTKAGQRNWIGKSVGAEISYLVPKFTEFVYATGNKAKVERVKVRFANLGLPIKLLTPAEAGLEVIEVAEGTDPWANAKAKAYAYKGKTDLPILGADTALELEGVDGDPAMVKRNALVAAGKDEKDLSQEEISSLMIDYYKKIAEENGGSVNGAFVDYWFLLLPDGREFKTVGRRELTLTPTAKGEVDPHFPIRAMYISKLSGKYVADQTPADLELEMKPISNSLKELFAFEIKVFTTRPDTQYGATFVALSPESTFVRENSSFFHNQKEIQEYIAASAKKTDLERMADNKNKTGVFTGLKAINRISGAEMPVYVADFVLSTVGTGALVGVPAHDARDFDFAKLMKLPVIRVIKGPEGKDTEITKADEVYTGTGEMINSDFLTAKTSQDAKEKIISWIEAEGWGKAKTNYKLRDWSISRQRYWGSPIPMVYKELSAADVELNKIYSHFPALILQLHALGSNSTESFHEAIDTQLTKMGIPVVSPNLPANEATTAGNWLTTAEENLAVAQENTIVVGRSLGGWTALQLAAERKLRKIILVAPATPVSIAYAEKVKKFSDQTVESLKEFVIDTEGSIDFKKVTENTAEIVIYLSKNDEIIPFKETQEYFRKNLPFARIVTFREAGHFTAEDGFKEFPILRDELLAPVRLDIQKLLDEDLPVILPEDADYRPKGTAPLGSSKTFQLDLNQEKYGPNAVREIDTIDTFVDSSWYFFRFLDPKNNSEMADPEKLNNFGPVDFYIGGAEHTVLHLLYARFFTKALFDAGMIDYNEPFLKLRHQGLILGPDGRKMSKRWGNVINPNDIVDEFGGDTLRMYEMFMGPLNMGKAWSEGGVRGIRRFIQRIYAMHGQISDKGVTDPGLTQLLNGLIDKVGEDISALKFNTAISEMMKFLNEAEEKGAEKISLVDWKKYILVLQPFAPFLSAEMWSELEPETEAEKQSWPTHSEVIGAINSDVTIVIMVNGRVRDNITAASGLSQADVEKLAQSSEKVLKYITGDWLSIKKMIFVPNKLLNIVI